MPHRPETERFTTSPLFAADISSPVTAPAYGGAVARPPALGVPPRADGLVPRLLATPVSLACGHRARRAVTFRFGTLAFDTGSVKAGK